LLCIIDQLKIMQFWP